MSFTLPQTWSFGYPVTVTKCETNTFGGTDVEVHFCGVDLAPFSFADYDVGKQGFDGLRNRIDTVVGEQIAAALRLAS